MKQLQLIAIFLFCITSVVHAQAPVNDDCSGLIDLGVAPICQTDVFYTNVDATASNIGVGNETLCFNGGTTQNDVWFAFTTADTISDYLFTVQGTDLGPNNQGLQNPQLAIYRGSCVVNGLAELACVSAENEQTQVQLEFLGLATNTTYFIRINDYSPSATPNWGDFTFCIDEYLPAVNIGESEGSQACFGTLYDSGGPDGNYGDGENLTFTICPQDFHQCIMIDLVDFGIENGFDQLSFFAGDNTSAPLIASITGFNTGADFPIQSSSNCITVQFTSDASINNPGFELTWQCTAAVCEGNDPIVIDAIPYDQGGFSTCETGATFAQTNCDNSGFLNGPETVFIYEAPGGSCASINVTGATDGTGVLVLDGPPTDANTNCVATSEIGFIGSANFEEAGTYYIVVANGTGCTDFGLDIMEAECGISPTLEDALCNPLNGCVEMNGLPSVFFFEQGFQDIDIVNGLNAGCWTGIGFQPDFYWFTIEAQADGPFGFILQGATVPSDIDFNVWGPFNPQEVCGNSDMIREFITNNQPIRSSYAPSDLATGMVEVHPFTGEIQEDAYDCGSLATPGAAGDDFTSVIQAQEGEVYVVLVNDFGDAIAEGGISVDWSPSNEAILDPLPDPLVLRGDTAICPGDMAQIDIESNINSITWLNDTESLSCSDCLNPIASPTETTTYRGVVSGVCTEGVVEVTVTVYALDAGPDQTVCRGEEIQIVSGANTEDGDYSWMVDNAGVTLSCTDCPNPIVTTNTAGTYTLSVTLEAPTCSFSDEMTLTVAGPTAPVFETRDSIFLCMGEETNLMIDAPVSNAYIWSSEPVGFTSVEANPTVQPIETTTYHVAVSNGLCPFPSMDSVFVEVSQAPVLTVSEDVAICQGTVIALANLEMEEGVIYLWSGPGDIVDASDPNSMATPQSSGTYTLTATRGACVVTASFDVEITPIGIDINNGLDTIFMCLGETVGLIAGTIPSTEMATWTPAEGLSSTTGNLVQATPTVSTLYTANVGVAGCEATDAIYIQVDSLPVDLSILPADTTVCQGEIVELISPTYEPGNFMNIEFMWTPMDGQESGDSLYNLVVRPGDTITYQRVTMSGACIDTAMATVGVIPPIEIMITPENPELCGGESVALMTSSDEPLEDYMWMPETGLSCTDCPNPTASPSTTTVYSVQAMSENGSCPAMGSVTIVVNETPSITPPTDTETCGNSGESYVLNLTPNNQFSYSWTSTDPSFVPTSAASPSVTPTMTATYTVVMQNGDCPTVTDQVTINVIEVGAVLTVPETQLACQGDNVTLTAESTQFGAFTWTDLDGVVLLSDDASFNPSTDSTGFMTYRVTFANECETLTDTVVVAVELAPTIDFPTVDTLCAVEMDTIILNEAPNDLFLYTWTSSNGTLNSTETAPTVIPLETTTYMVTVESGVCTPLEEEFTINVLGNSTLNTSNDTTIVVATPPNPLTISASTLPPNASGSYSWTLNGNEVSTTASVSPFTGETGNFAYVVTYLDMCEIIMDTVFVNIVEKPRVPNVFTPNGDEVNPTFNVIKSDNFTTTIFRIYNRWGQLVFDDPTNEEGWDGTYNGKLAPSDVYVYYIVTTNDDTGEEFLEQGDVTLVR